MKIFCTQFFARDDIEDGVFLKTAHTFFGFEIASLECDENNASAFAQITRYSEGFRVGYLISWPDKLSLAGNIESIVQNLSNKLQSEMLLEPDTHESLWQLFSPGKEIRLVSPILLDDGIDISQSVSRPASDK